MGKLLVYGEVDEEIKEVYKVFDRDDHGINATELSKIMTALMSNKTQHKKHRDRPAGELYDDSISGSELDSEKIIITIADAEDMIAEYDIDGDGKLSYEEFVKILTDKPKKPYQSQWNATRHQV